jgi:hypothetical protein
VPLHHLELMAEHDNLDIFLDAAETMNSKKIEGAPDETKEEREGRDPRGSPQASGLVKLAFEVCASHRPWWCPV